jgi:hypothetical protein
MSILKKLLLFSRLILIAGAFTIGLSGCPEREGPAERTGEEIDETVEEGGEEMEEAGEEVEESAE